MRLFDRLEGVDPGRERWTGRQDPDPGGAYIRLGGGGEREAETKPRTLLSPIAAEVRDSGEAAKVLAPSFLRWCLSTGLWRPPRWSPVPQRRPLPPPRMAAGADTRRPPRQPMGQGPPVGRTPRHPPHRGAARVRAGAAVAARRHRRARAAAPPTAAQSGRGGAAGAGAERHVDAGGARLTSRTTWVGTKEDGMGGGSAPAAVASLVRHPRTWSARRRWRTGDCTGLLSWPPCGVGEKGVEKYMEAPLVWRDSGEV